METQNRGTMLNIPIAIIIAGAIIAGSIIYTKGPGAPANTLKANALSSFENQFKPVTEKDHILGNPNAKIKIVEYSDPSCPFCKVFHNTMNKIMNEFGTTGNVAWVYRHYPLDKEDASGNILHPNAGHESQALECAAELGGNDKFWKYTNRLYEITPSVTGATPNGLDQNELPKIAQFTGLDINDFNNCLATGKYKDKIENDFLDGVNIGVQGTPTSIIVLDKPFPDSLKEKIMQIYDPYKDPTTGEYPIRISEDSRMIMFGGAMPIEVVKATINLFFTY
jgi:protein-disulfide isomerase